MEVITNSAEETKKFGKDFAKKLKPGQTVCLFGDLGSGKTTLVQGLAQGLGIKKRILSPAFLFVREYKIPQNKFNKFYHIDLFRLEPENSFENLGLEEILSDKKSLIVIEWAQKARFLPKKRVEINFSYGKKESQRKIKIRRRD